MRPARLLAGVLAMVVVALTPLAAHGVAADATRNPEVLWPLARDGNRDGRVHLVVNGERGHAWGLRRFVREADRQIAGVEVDTLHGLCREHPGSVCVRIERADYGDTGWLALTTFVSSTMRIVQLNDHYDGWEGLHRYACAAHEFGHVLGLQHHRRLGVDGRRPNMVHLSHAELRALRAAYPKETLS